MAEHDTLAAIVQCRFLADVLHGDRGPCSDIVHVQAGPHRQVPEPWSGHLVNAPLLFLSSNPSIDENPDLETREVYPDSTWETESIRTFFEGRFGSYVEGGSRPLLNNGARRRSVPFWAEVRQRASEIFGREVEPGTDYAMTEVVHCKSKSEIGVEAALHLCSQTYLDRVLSASGAKVIAITGSVAARGFASVYPAACEGLPTNPVGHIVSVTIGEQPRLVAFLRHPNFRGNRRLVNPGVMPLSDLLRLRDAVLDTGCS